MCCDGTLFDGVQLEPGDDAARLRALGLPVTFSRSRKPVARFPQPCAALCADRSCRVYPDRPRQCRIFECGVFKKTKAGELPPDSALKLVKKGRRLSDQVRRLLQRMGDNDSKRGLGERFFRMQCRMEEEQTDDVTRALFADLSLAVHRLKLLAHDQFYTPPDEHTGPPRSLV